MPPRATEDANQRGNEQGEEQGYKDSVDCDLSFHRYFLQIFVLSCFYFLLDKFYCFSFKRGRGRENAFFHALALHWIKTAAGSRSMVLWEHPNPFRSAVCRRLPSVRT